MGHIWSGTIFLLLVYAAAIVWFGSDLSLDVALGKAFPKLHHPLVVIGAGLFGLFCLASAIWNRRNPRKTEPWIRTNGTIISSVTESYTQTETSSGHRTRTYYKAVIEFSYNVNGQEYHTTKGASDFVKISWAYDRAGADAEVARYPAGRAVDVFYDPQNPLHASLNSRNEITLTGKRSLVVAVISFAVALYAAFH